MPEDPKFLVLDEYDPDEAKETCCMCGQQLEKSSVLQVARFRDDQEPRDLFLCVECACAYWYVHLFPASKRDIDPVLDYCVLAARFYDDALKTIRLFWDSPEEDIKVCAQVVQDLLCTALPGQATCVISNVPGLPHHANFLVLDLKKEHLWFLQGDVDDLYGFCLALRWTHRLVAQPVANVSVKVSSKASVHKMQWFRFELAIASADTGTELARIIHYGKEPSLDFALAGVRFSLKTRWGSRVRVPRKYSSVKPKLIRRDELDEELFRLSDWYTPKPPHFRAV